MRDHKEFAHDHSNQFLESTTRVEAYSDAIIAIIMTLLILEIRIPELHQPTNRDILYIFIALAPKFLSFTLSFITLAIIWVNHHHFFHPIKGTDKSLLWHNNHLMFWVCVIPFATAFLGDYYQQPLVVAFYGFVMFMMAIAFMMMIHYTFFKSALLDETIPMEARRAQFNRSLFGPFFYGSAAVIALFAPTVSLGMFVMVLVFYFLPQQLHACDGKTQ